jgi:hypothetical protein
MSGSTSSLTKLNGTPGELEGWRAVLSVVLRYDATRKQRLGYSRSMSTGQSLTGLNVEGGDTSEAVQEADPVAAMVEEVKARGVSHVFVVSVQTC